MPDYDPTCDGLELELTYRLNDIEGGNFTAAEITSCVNTGKRETELATKCHKAVTEVTVVAGTATADCGLVFEPIQVSLGDTAFKRVDPADLPIKLEKWYGEPNGDPEDWFQKTGPTIQIRPAPDSGAAGVIGVLAATPIAAGASYVAGDVLKITGGEGDATCEVLSVDGSGGVTAVQILNRGKGYTTGTKATTEGTGGGCTISVTSLAKFTILGYAITNDISGTDKVTSIPRGYATSAILDRAEAEARKMRSTTANNANLHTELMQSWGRWVEKIRSSIRGDG
jgi:hypothetical protein